MLWEKAPPMSPHLICAKKQRKVVGCLTGLDKGKPSVSVDASAPENFLCGPADRQKRKDSGCMDSIRFLFLIPSFSLSLFLSFTSSFHHLAMFHLLSPDLCFPSFITRAA